jgi:hypothetical protein
VVEEKTLFGERIASLEEFILDLGERLDGVYQMVMQLESKTSQLAAFIGFLKGFRGRLHRVCDGSLDSKFSNKRRESLVIVEETTFFGEPIDTPKEFLNDLRDRVDTVYESTMEEEEGLPRLAYLIGAMTGLKGRLNRVCGTT